MSHSCVQNYLHIIFSTKNRDALIPLELENRLYDYFCGISENQKTPILKINGTDDHIHMLLKLHPSVALSTLVKELKSYSSGWIKKDGFKNFAWQEGYGAFACSNSHIKPLIQYIENQKNHHLKITFQQEVDQLNRKWNTNWMKD